MFEPEVEFHAPPRESKSKRWLSFHPFSGVDLWSARSLTHLFENLFLHEQDDPEESRRTCATDLKKLEECSAVRSDSTKYVMVPLDVLL